MDSPKPRLSWTSSVPQSPSPNSLSSSAASRELKTNSHLCCPLCQWGSSPTFILVLKHHFLREFSNTLSTALAPCYPCHSIFLPCFIHLHNTYQYLPVHHMFTHLLASFLFLVFTSKIIKITRGTDWIQQHIERIIHHDTTCTNAGDTGSIPGLGRSHMATEQLTLYGTTAEPCMPVLHKRSHGNEEPLYCN